MELNIHNITKIEKTTPYLLEDTNTYTTRITIYTETENIRIVLFSKNKESFKVKSVRGYT